MVSSSSQSQNITEQYVDLETRLSSLRTKHQRLLDLLAQADSMETIVALESELEMCIRDRKYVHHTRGA